MIETNAAQRLLVTLSKSADETSHNRSAKEQRALETLLVLILAEHLRLVGLLNKDPGAKTKNYVPDALQMWLNKGPVSYTHLTLPTIYSV